MFDFVIQYPIDMSLGVVAARVGDLILITAESFAPGVWAGTEGMNIRSGKGIYSVRRVSLDDRIIEIDRRIEEDVTNFHIYHAARKPDESI